MTSTYAEPTEAERRRERSARAAHWAIVLAEARRRTVAEGNPTGMPGAVYGTYATAQCSVCGGNAGSWCDPCHDAGRTFRSVYGGLMHGSPVCHDCDDAGQCGVCWRGGTSAEDAAEEEPEANPGERTLAASCVAGDAEPAGSQRGLIRQGGGWEKKIERHAWVRPNDLKRERGAATGGAG